MLLFNCSVCLIYKKFDWREDWFKILRSNKNFPLSTNSLFKFVVQFIRSKNRISPMYGGNSYHRGKSTWTLVCGFWCEAVLGKYMCHSQICSISESVAYWILVRNKQKTIIHWPLLEHCGKNCSQLFFLPPHHPRSKEEDFLLVSETGERNKCNFIYLQSFKRVKCRTRSFNKFCFVQFLLWSYGERGG